MISLSTLYSSNIDSLAGFRGELVIAASLLVVLLIRAFYRGKSRLAATLVASVALFVSCLIFIRQIQLPFYSSFNGLFIMDSFTSYFRVLFVFIALATIVVGHFSAEIDGTSWSEVIALVLSMVLGMILLAGSGDVVLLYVALELVGIPAYALVALRRFKNAGSALEAAIKYLLYGALCSAVVLFGLSLLFVYTGSTSLDSISLLLRTVVSGKGIEPAVVLGFFMLFLGLGFKIAMVPVHMWCPDVYEGAPTVVTSFLAAGSKAAGFAVILRFFFSLADTANMNFFETMDFKLFVGLVSAVTMTLGNLAALRQSGAKRLLAYSSIAHAGYVLMGLAVLTPLGLEAALFYLAVYAVMNMGAFFVVMMVEEGTGSDAVESFHGLGWKSPLVAFCMALFMFSLTGLPPMAGFVGKMLLFAAAIKGNMVWLAVVAAVNGVISLFYYARFLKVMYLESPSEGDLGHISSKIVPLSVVTVFALVLLAAGIYWQPLENVAKIASWLLR